MTVKNFSPNKGSRADRPVTPDELVLAEVGEIDLYQHREKIYTRKIEGFFQRIRLFTGWPLLLGYLLMPWLVWDGHQAMLFDLPARKFHILFLTFWPQDFPLLAWLMIVGAFALFTVTNLAGRVWCGYTCPQTVWTAIYMWVEQKTEGSRNKRIKLDQAPWTLSKFGKKLAKHCMWLGFAFITGFTFIAYFLPAYELAGDFVRGDAPLVAYGWIVFFTLATYLNAGWMREQVCMYMCPYARFQSVMFDSDTLIVSYDSKRGEQRGSRKRTTDVSAQRESNLGDCIDCKICVQVCPTGIDIRDGLQYECIGCALCVDACDSVMDQMNYDRGLIRYTTENILAGGQTKILRPRLMAYSAVLLVITLLFGVQMFNRSMLELDVIRDRQQLFNLASNGDIENTYRLKIANITEQPGWFSLEVDGVDGLSFSGLEQSPRFYLEGGSSSEEILRLSTSPDNLNAAVNSIQFRLLSESDSSIHDSQDSRFIGPVVSAGGN